MSDINILRLFQNTTVGRSLMKKIILSFLIVFLITDISAGEEKKDFEGMVFIKGGCFEMGDTFGDGSSDEKSVHEVCVDDFFIGEHEVTQREWEEIMGNNPSYFKNCGDNCPVEQVAYDDVQKYIRRLNIKTGLNYRLPTEAEWEYAAREGGRIVRFGTGKDTIGPDEANFDASSKYKKPYSRSGVYREKTVPVKSFSPNSLGLYDLSGNVWEWVQDWYDTGYYKRSPRNNPKGPSSGSGRVMRGGSWYDLPRRVRAAFRFGDAPSGRVSVTGFRLALEVSGQD
jgi:formylglycine-generating enzyme required for sulfatase activity